MERKKKILIVDDEKELVELMRIRLEAYGYEIITAYNGNQALYSATREKPDLIIMDVMMPGEDGYSVCKKLKRSNIAFTIPIIFLTGRDSKKDEVEAYKVGVVYYIRKPYDPEVMLNTVKNALSPSEKTKIVKGSFRKQILIIEEQIEIQVLVNDHFMNCGFEFFFVDSLENAMDIVKNKRLDLIIMNGTMAKAWNYRDFYLLKHDYTLGKLPIIITTHQEELEEFNEKLENVSLYCFKPFEPKDVLHRIKMALGEI